jgi:hypothetical protein
MGKKYAFVEKDLENVCSDRRFVRLHIDTIHSILADPTNTLLFTDLYPSGEYFIRYFQQNPHIISSPHHIILYHKKKMPKKNPLFFSTRSFCSSKDLLFHLEKDADEIIFL